MAITGVEIAKNKCAPAGVDSILLYNSDLAQGLTLTQLVQQVCIRAAAVGEAQSVLKMNAMTSESQRLSEAADWLKQIVDGTANWTKARDFLVGKMAIPEATLPTSLTINGKPYYNYQMQAAKALWSNGGSGNFAACATSASTGCPSLSQAAYFLSFSENQYG